MLKCLNLTLSQRGILNVGRARPTDIFVLSSVQ